MNRPLCILVAALAISAPSFRAAYAQGDADYGKIPLSFEANKGQTDGRVRYLARGAGYTVFLTPGETVLRLAHKSRGLSQGSVLRMRMIGAADSPSIEAEEQVESRSNYFLGADPATWRSGVAHFGRVRYRDVYPGIDAVYYGNQRQLEYDFVVAPGADPSAIRFAIEGADRVHVDSAGNLVISIAGGQLIQHRPRLYQVNGLAKTSVDGNYVLTSGRFVSFEVAGYNHSRPLVIDPALSYATFLGGNGNETVAALAVDATGNAYVAGTTDSINFPTAAGSYDEACGTDGNCNTGNTDIFLAKVNPTGTALVYSTYIGGRAAEYVTQVLVDPSGDAYVVGRTDSPDFPITAGAFKQTPGTYLSTSNFLLKVNPAGTQVVYSTYTVGGETIAALGPGGAVYLAGSYGQTTPGAFQAIQHSSYPADAYVARLNAAGTALDFGTYLGGSGEDTIAAIVVDPVGNAIVAGTTTSLDFPVTVGSYQPAFPKGPSPAPFLAKLNPTGTALVFGTYGPGSGNSWFRSIVLDSNQNIYVSDVSSVSKVDPAGSSLLFSATGQDAAQLYVDGSDTVFMVVGQQVKKVTPTGVAPVFTTAIPVTCCGPSVSAMDLLGNLYVGWSGSVSGRATTGAFQQNSQGGSDIFLAKITPGAGSLRVFPASVVAISSSSYPSAGTSKAAWAFSDGAPHSIEVPATIVADSPWVTSWSFPSVLFPESRLESIGPTLRLALSPTSASGVQNGSVTVTSRGATNSPLSIPVSLTVTSLPFAEFSETALTFGYTPSGELPVAQSAHVYCMNGNVSFTVTPSGGSWLSATPQTGSTNTTVSVSVNPVGLAEGSYLGTVDLKSPGLPTVQLPIRLIVSAPRLTLSSAALAFTLVQGKPSAGSQTLDVTGLSGAYSVLVSGGVWLSVSPTSGSLPAHLGASVNGAGLAPGTYRATVTISGPGGSIVNVPVTFVISPPNTLTLSTNSLAFSYWPGATAPPQNVSITSEPSVNWSAFATSTGTWFSMIPIGGSTPGTLSVSVNPTGLAEGNYTGTITVVAPDATNSPQTISVSMTVSASQPITFVPSTLSFSTSPGISPAPQTIAVSAASGQTYTAAASSAGDWLSVSPASGSMPGSLSVSVNPGSLTAGTYSGTIALSVTQQDKSVVAASVPVTLHVVGKNELRITPASMDLTYWPGASVAAQTITVSMESPAYWTCSSSVAWLNCFPNLSTTAWIMQNFSGLAPGRYTGMVTVSSDSASNGPQAVTVNLTVLSSPPVFTTPPGPLSFTSVDGATPSPQVVSVSAATPTAMAVSAVVYSPSSSATWLSVTPTSGATPKSLTVSANPAGLGPGTYNGEIRITISGGVISVPVSLQIGPRLSASVASVSLTSPLGSSGAQSSGPINVTSTASGGQYRVTVSPTGTWLTTTLTAGTTPGSFQVIANPTGMAAGSYTGSVNISSEGAVNNIVIPVSFLVASTAAVNVAPAGLSFSYEINGTSPLPQMITATASSTTMVSASVSGGSWLAITPTAGQTPATFGVMVRPSDLTAGVYSGTVAITAGFNQLTVPVTLTVQQAPQLLVSSASLAFAATPGKANPPAQSVQVTSVGRAIGFQASTSDSWLKLIVTRAQTPAEIGVSVDATQLKPGAYAGSITVAGGSAGSRTINVSLTVSSLPLLSVSPTEMNVVYVAGDDVPPSLPVVLFSDTRLPYGLHVTSSGWLKVSRQTGVLPDVLQASFEPAALSPGTYEGTIQVAAVGASNTSDSVKIKLIVKAAPPIVYPGGVVNSASFLYGPVAPGSRVAIFGENFSEIAEVADKTPWPTSLQRVSVTVNGFAAPLGMVSPNQIEAQIPSEAAVGIARIVVTVDGRSSAPVIAPIVSTAPGIFYSPGASSAVQNADFSSNSPSTPVRCGSVVVAYMTGQGALDGRLVSGTASPDAPYLKPVLPVRALVDDRPAEVLFAAMAPGQVGILQANIVLPEMPPGEHLLKVTIGGVPSNAVPVFVTAADQ